MPGMMPGGMSMMGMNPMMAMMAQMASMGSPPESGDEDEEEEETKKARAPLCKVCVRDFRVCLKCVRERDRQHQDMTTVASLHWYRSGKDLLGISGRGSR